MASVGYRAVRGFHRHGVVGAEERLDGPLGAAEVDLEALSRAGGDGVLSLKRSPNTSREKTLAVNGVLGGCGKSVLSFKPTLHQ